MHYVKHFEINGVDTKQVACIELPSKPNAATEGSVGLLGIDMSSPTHDVYKCVAVNGSIYTWELLSSGLSTIAAAITGNGEELVQFPYDTLKIPSGYVMKVGDLIIDSKGYEYQVSALDVTSCSATYCGSAFLKGEPGDDGLTPYIGENGHWWIGDIDTGVIAPAEFGCETGSYSGTNTYGAKNPNTLVFTDIPSIVIVTCVSVTGHWSPLILIHGMTKAFVPGSESYNGDSRLTYAELTVSWDDANCSVSWYSTESAQNQQNYGSDYDEYDVDYFYGAIVGRGG